MKITKLLGILAVGTLALMASVGTASATTLSTKGVATNAAETINASLKSGTTWLLTDTAGFFANTCTGATMVAKTEGSFTGATVGGKVSSLTFKPCTREEVVVHLPGSLSFTHIAGTTNATVRSIGASWTVPSPFGLLTCTTALEGGTDIGTLTGVKTGFATLDINAVLNCTLGTAKMSATYSITSPADLGTEA